MVVHFVGVRRTELEMQLRRLGWMPSARKSGKNHRVWTHPKREFEIFVPQYDLIPIAVSDRILEEAGE